jgi:hypothetical protein
MNSKLSYQVENGILMCFLTGERSVGEALEYWRKLIRYCQIHQISRLQLTIAMRGKFSPFEAIKNYQAIIDLLKPLKLKIAIVDLNHLSAADSQVACNMGASQGLNAAYFETEEQAKSWLMSESVEKILSVDGCFTKESVFGINSVNKTA